MKKPSAISHQPSAGKIRKAFVLQATSYKLQAGQKGFTLLLAALISSIVLALGAAVFSIAQKELALSSLGRNSQFAFYAADTGAECALFWDFRSDIHPNTFATSSYSSQSSVVSCAQNNPSPAVTVIASSLTAATSTFDLTLTQIDPPKVYCAKVTVAKSRTTEGGGIIRITNTIHSDGYSTACNTILTDPQALQRSVELHY